MKTLYYYYIAVKRYPLHILFLILLQPFAIYIDTVLISNLYKHVIQDMYNPSVKLYSYVTTIINYYIIMFILWRIIGYIIVYFEANVKKYLEQDVYKHIILLSYSFFTSRFTGSIVAQTNRFVNAFERLFDTFYFDFYRILLYVLFTIYVLYFVNPLISFSTLLWTIIFIGTNIFLQYKKSPFSIEAASYDSKTTAHISDTLSNIFTIKTFAKEAYEVSRFNNISNTKAKKVILDWFFAEGIVAWQAFVMIVFEIFLLWYSIGLVIEGKVTVAQIVQIQILIFPLMSTLWHIGKVIRNVERSFADAYEMSEIIAKKPLLLDKENAVDFNKTEKLDITFDKIYYKYFGNSKLLFDNFSLYVKNGQRIGLVGKSGSGKTTLTKLLMRIMDVKCGAIHISNTNIQDVTQKSLRELISYVPQEPQLFHRSILDNIRYDDENISKNEVIEAAKKAEAHEFIIKLSDGYDTFVGERGAKLSGGERQRIALARAILKNAPIIILDEATSALDSESEILIQKALEEVLKDKTAIVIAHRLSTIQKLDRIVVLENGIIIEDGSHKELLDKRGKYYELWNHQSGGFIKE